MHLAYTENQGAHSQALVFLHAFPLNRFMWKYQVEGLEDSIWVLAPDLPGFGGSPRLDGPPSMKAYADELLAFLDQMGIEKAVFGGCSMGGYIQFELWRNAPERVAGLILCDTKAEADSPEARTARLNSMEPIRRDGPAGLAENMTPKLVSPDTYQHRPALVNELINAILANSTEGILDAQLALADRPDSTETLPTITVPVLILVGEDDGLTPPAVAQAMQPGIRDSRLGVLHRAGHLSPLERPEHANTAIRTFLVESGLI